MTPLINDCELLKRPILEDDVFRTIYLLYEGQNTEVSLINPLIANTAFFKQTPVRFITLKKTNNDIGKTQPLAMIGLANDYVRSHCGPRGSFKCGRDKVLIVFDLDTKLNDQEAMDKIGAAKTSDMILCYTNPAIELFLMLAKKGSYEKYIEPHKKEILANGWVGDDRYILHFFKSTYGLDPKEKDADFRFIVESLDVSFLQENMFLNHWLSKAANTLTSNIAYVLTKIRDGKIDEIEY